MPIATSTLRYTNWLKVNPQNGARLTDPLEPAALERALATRRLPIGPAGTEAIRALYAEASRNGTPTYASFQRHIERTERQLRDERAPGRVNDGFVDAREVALLRSPAATATFEFLQGRFPATGTTADGAKATVRQLDRALETLLKTVDAAFKTLPKRPAPDYRQVVTALRAAGAGLPKPARDALVIAANAVTGRGAGGSLTDGRATPPASSDIKDALRRAHAALRSADGAQVEDLVSPVRPGASRRDGVVTELEMSRTRAVRGKTSRALFDFARSL
jgi:hypothetical protein